MNLIWLLLLIWELHSTGNDFVLQPLPTPSTAPTVQTITAVPAPTSTTTPPTALPSPSGR